MSLIKLATNRMTKELENGRLSSNALNTINSTIQKPDLLSRRQYLIGSIIGKDNPNKFLTKSIVENTPTAVGNSKFKQINALNNRTSIFRSDTQLANGITKGNQELATRIGAKHFIEPVPAQHGLGMTYPKDMTPDGKIHVIQSNKPGIDSAIAGRHEIFEAQSLKQHGYTTQGSVISQNKLVGNHNNLNVLGKESNLIARMPNPNVRNLHTSIRQATGEAGIIKNIANIKYGVKASPLQINKLTNAVPSRLSMPILFQNKSLIKGFTTKL